VQHELRTFDDRRRWLRQPPPTSPNGRGRSKHGGDLCLRRQRWQESLAMFETLVHDDVDWAATRIYQVDERVVREDNDERNLKSLRRALKGTNAPIEAMDVESDDLEVACWNYASLLPSASTSYTSVSGLMGTALHSSRVIRCWSSRIN